MGQAPEIQRMYNLPLPVSTIRTRMRQEFEKHRFAAKLPVVDVLLMKNNAEYQVRSMAPSDHIYPPVPATSRHVSTKGKGLRMLIRLGI